ncbi:MAG: citrate/2-methylcitrate synthase [Acidilobaceae archaeon]|nr:citrate/2-methylcitrate synthase [Acidilobaceae archaeon]MDW7974455.1 citrate/2-methylcitrate synthase [Sulfolobales archaeon]
MSELLKKVNVSIEEIPGLGSFIVVPKGLEQVITDTTSISGVDPRGENTLYRGYTIEDLGMNADFYEAAYLISYGTLPTEEEYKEYRKKVDYWRTRVPEKVYDALKLLPQTHPMYYGAYGALLLGQIYAPEWRLDKDYLYEHQIRLIAQLPVIFAAAYNLAYHGTFLRPEGELSHAHDLLRMITMRDHSELEVRAFESSLILYMDHGFNASTFAVRVVGSTLSDMYSAVAAGIAALKGPLHGGANEEAMKMFLEVKKKASEKGVPMEEYIVEYIKEKLARKERVMGFGHRVYKLKDPRTDVAAEFVRKLKDGETWYKVIKAAEKVMWEAKRIPANIDLYTAILYYQLHIPVPMYTPVFAMGRVVGWTSHYIEQSLDNKLIRPTEKYVGPVGLKYQPMTARR